MCYESAGRLEAKGEEMIVDITEEEREFLERVCHRAERFAFLGLKENPFDKDLEKVMILKNKFRALDPNLMNRYLSDEK